MSYVFRPYRGDGDAAAMAAVRLACCLDVASVVEKLPTAAEIASSGPKLVVERDGDVVGYAVISWWRERDGTWLYLHRGFVRPGHRGQGVGSTLLAWAEDHIRQLVREHATAETAVFGANAMAAEEDSTALLLNAGYHRVFSLVELELADLNQLPAPDLPAGIRLGPVDTSGYHDAWRTAVDSYADADAVPEWPFESFLAAADPLCWRAAWDGSAMVGVALCSLRAHHVGEVEELSVQASSRRRGIGRAVLLDGLRCLREHGAVTARLYTGTANPHRSYDLYESVGFQRRHEYVRYRKAVSP